MSEWVDPAIPELMTATDAAAETGISAAHIGRMWAAGKFPARRVGRALMIRPEIVARIKSGDLPRRA